MMHYRFSVITISRTVNRTLEISEGVKLITPYKPNILFEKWITSEIRVPLFEQILREIVGDKPTLGDIKEILFNHLYKQEVFSASRYRDAYYEIKEVLKYASESIVIDKDEALLLIESGIVRVDFKDGVLDVATILAEREVNG